MNRIQLYNLRQRTTLITLFGLVIIILTLIAVLFIYNKKTARVSTPIVPPKYHIIEKDISVKNYFAYLDSLTHWNDTLNYPMSEHLIVNHNPWIIDTLAETDYYRLQAKGIFNYDQPSLVVLHKGDTLIIPDSLAVESLLKKRQKTVIDVNIPEYKLRIMEGKKVLYTFDIRVGQNRSKYLEMAGRSVDLRTHTGIGAIVRINKNAAFVNPSNNHRYYTTRRDDGKRTLVPITPWLEPELNGTRYGQLIHPTTNPATLGKAYSNGCIGMREADVWRLYYYAPLGTKVVFRYDLKARDENGKRIKLDDIYPNKKHRNNLGETAMQYEQPMETMDFREVTVNLADIKPKAK